MVAGLVLHLVLLMAASKASEKAVNLDAQKGLYVVDNLAVKLVK